MSPKPFTVAGLVADTLRGVTEDIDHLEIELSQARKNLERVEARLENRNHIRATLEAFLVEHG